MAAMKQPVFKFLRLFCGNIRHMQTNRLCVSVCAKFINTTSAWYCSKKLFEKPRQKSVKMAFGELKKKTPYSDPVLDTQTTHLTSMWMVGEDEVMLRWVTWWKLQYIPLDFFGSAVISWEQQSGSVLQLSRQLKTFNLSSWLRETQFLKEPQCVLSGSVWYYLCHVFNGSQPVGRKALPRAATEGNMLERRVCCGSGSVQERNSLLGSGLQHAKAAEPSI